MFRWLFRRNSKKSISFYKFYSSLSSWTDSKRKPTFAELPDEISFDRSFYTKLINLHKQTLSDGLERAISVFWVEGELVISSTTVGDEKSVKPSNKISVQYKPTHKREYFEKRTLLDGKVYSKRKVYYKKVPKKINLKYLFNMHTHPPHGEPGNRHYSFFSAQDAKSLVNSGALVTGMISDKLWLMFQTNKTPSSLGELSDYEMNPQNIKDKYGLITYSGDFRSKVKRVG